MKNFYSGVENYLPDFDDYILPFTKVLSAETGLSISTVKRVISELQKKHIIRRKGNNRNGVWEILVS